LIKQKYSDVSGPKGHKAVKSCQLKLFTLKPANRVMGKNVIECGALRLRVGANRCLEASSKHLSASVSILNKVYEGERVVKLKSIQLFSES